MSDFEDSDDDCWGEIQIDPNREKYTVVRNSCINDSRLSMEDLGALTYINYKLCEGTLQVDEIFLRFPEMDSKTLGRTLDLLENLNYIKLTTDP